MIEALIFILLLFISPHEPYYPPVETVLVEEVAIPQNKTQEVIVTCYTASVEECGKTDGITASGTLATEGRTIACDHLDIGTRVIIDGHEYIVEDRFGGGHTNKIDIYVEDRQQALNHGVQTKVVEIIEED